MSDLKKQLIRLGSTNPELRPHIRKVLAAGMVPNNAKFDNWIERMLTAVADNTSVGDLELEDWEFTNGKLDTIFNTPKHRVEAVLGLNVLQNDSVVSVDATIYHDYYGDVKTPKKSSVKFQVPASGGVTVSMVGNQIGKTILSRLR